MDHHSTTKDTTDSNTLGIQIIVPSTQELADYAYLADNGGIMDRKTFNAIKLQESQASTPQGAKNAVK